MSLKKQKRNEIQERCVCTKNCDSDIHLPGPCQIVLQFGSTKAKRNENKVKEAPPTRKHFGLVSDLLLLFDHRPIYM